MKKDQDPFDKKSYLSDLLNKEYMNKSLRLIRNWRSFFFRWSCIQLHKNWEDSSSRRFVKDDERLGIVNDLRDETVAPPL